MGAFMSHGTFAHLEGHRGGLLDITVESRGAGDAAETGEAGSRGGNRRGGCAAQNRHDWVRAGQSNRLRRRCRGRLL